MGLFDGCLLASDIDGTLIESGFIHPDNIKKIDYFTKEGGYFVISTGRGKNAFSEVLSKIGSISHAVSCNGCIAHNTKTSEILYNKLLEKEDYRVAELLYESNMNIGIEVHCGDNVYTIRRTEAIDIHQNYEKFTSPDTCFEDICGKNWNKVIFTFDSKPEKENAKEIISKQKNSCVFIDTCAEIEGKMYYYYEQLPKGVSKYSALEALCQKLDIKKGGFFAIGDFYNDLEMIKKADIGATLEDTPQDIKREADYITVPCRDGAVADFIDYLTRKFSAADGCI